MLTDYRNNDAVITVCQNNKAEIITITEINDVARELLGFSANEIVGKQLKTILPQRIGELLTEYVVFENDANDVGLVLAKVHSFSVIDNNGVEKAYRVKVVRVPPADGNLFFLLILQDSLGARKNEAVRKAIRENFRGHEALDPKTGLPDRESLVQDINIMKRYIATNNMMACFAALQIDGYNDFILKYGADTSTELLKHVASLTKRSMRPDDIVGSIGKGRIGVLLVDIARDSERLVLNRLRWQIAANPYSVHNTASIGVSVSISFCAVALDVMDNEIVKKCEDALDKLGDHEHNILVEAKS